MNNVGVMGEERSPRRVVVQLHQTTHGLSMLSKAPCALAWLGHTDSLYKVVGAIFW